MRLQNAIWYFKVNSYQEFTVKPVSKTSAQTRAQALVDTHVHVFDPARFPYAEGRRYTPGSADLVALETHLAGLEATAVVLVQPSVYGTDNRCLLDALSRLGPRGRGIACLDVAATAANDLKTVHAAGVRGMRLNFAVEHEDDAGRATQALRKAAALVRLDGWCVQVHCTPRLLPALEVVLDEFQVPVVLDHFAVIRAATSLNDPSMSALKQLLSTGRVYVKASAFYRASSHPAYEDLEPLLRELIAVRSDRVVWGSDWPHTGSLAERTPEGIEPFQRADLPATLDLVARCVPSAAVLHAVVAGNAARLYGFDHLLEST